MQANIQNAEPIKVTVIKSGVTPKTLIKPGALENPIVLNNCDIDPNIFSGLAFGLGVERIAMLKYGVNDIREFYKSNLDFFAITDHAEWLTSREWNDTISSIQNCASTSSDLDNPPIIPLLGWEWTQKSINKSNHYGHKNVILRSIENDAIPLRPIGAEGKFFESLLRIPISSMLGASLYDFKNRQNYFNFRHRKLITENLNRCSSDKPVRDLPVDCIER